MSCREENLLNLLKIGKLKAEPPDAGEIAGLVRSARRKLPDAAHSLALAALRRCGYRSANRQIVFQSLAHTLDFPPAKWRFLDNCHQKRNAALYDGDYAEDEQLIRELLAAAQDLLLAVDSHNAGDIAAKPP